MSRFLLIAAVLVVGLNQFQPVKASFEDLGKSNSQFALEMYKKLRTNNEDNIFFSPLSISTALGMTYLGARGNTKTQMGKVLHFDVLGDSVHQDFQNLNKILYNKANNYTLKSANRLFGQKGNSFEQTFIDDSKKYYSAEAKELDFVTEPDKSRVKINDWVEDQTEDKIKNLMPKGSITKETIMVLVNAIYFKGSWEFPFKEKDTKDEDFHLSLERKGKVPMMFQEKYYQVSNSSELGARILDMNYNGKNVCITFMVPHGEPGKGLEALEDKLTEARLTAALQANTRSQKIKVYVPRLKIEDEFSLSKQLKSLGMTDLFSDNADLSGMDKIKKLQVTEVKHKSFLVVNEKGTEAAAATGVVVGVTSIQKPPAPFRLDRPFLFLIREKVSGSILFMGRVRAPPGIVVAATSSAPATGLTAILMIMSCFFAFLKI